MSDNSINQTVRDMAKLSMFSNRLSDVQINNLKMYPFIFFEGVQSVKLDYDLDQARHVGTSPNKETLEIEYSISNKILNHTISYNLKVGGTPQTYLSKRVQALTQAVHDLLWKDIEVKILLNGKKIKEEENV